MNIYFGRNLRQLRNDRNLTQERLADFLGVSFQTISKWERDESYPDIAMLPAIASFFNVSVDDLLGVNCAETEAEILSLIKDYDNLTDKSLKKELLDKLIEKAPNDFRIQLRELGYLIHFCDCKKYLSRINTIYDNIQLNCNIDRIRICATRHITYLYADLAQCNESSVSFDDVEKILKNMPYMRDGQEFISSYLYPVGHPDYYKNIQEAIEEEIGLLDTSIAHYYLYDENFCVEYKIDMLKKCIDILNMIYDDGNYGEEWKSAIYSYGHLGHFCFEIGDKEKAVEHLKTSAELAKKFDDLDRITIMHSKLFEGRTFDKHKIGSTYIACSRMKYLMTEKYPLSDEFKESKEFKEIIEILS
ncbi:MAG: helix-turn-helix domain-containing protein [Eubacterium sp.]